MFLNQKCFFFGDGLLFCKNFVFTAMKTFLLRSIYFLDRNFWVYHCSFEVVGRVLKFWGNLLLVFGKINILPAFGQGLARFGQIYCNIHANLGKFR